MSTPLIDTENAYRIEESIRRTIGAARAQWPRLAMSLFAFHRGQAWKALGVESFNEWVAQPEIGMSRSSVYAYIDCYETVCVENGLPLDALEVLEPSKVQVVLRAIKAGVVEVEDALADALSLSKSDLKEKYASPLSDQLDAEAEPAICPECGQKVKVSK